MHLHVYEWELSALHMLTLVCTGPETDELGRLYISIPLKGHLGLVLSIKSLSESFPTTHRTGLDNG